MTFDAEAVGMLVLRLSIAGIYIYAAYQNTKAFKEYTVPETSLLFTGTQLKSNTSFIRFAAAMGLVVMYCGSTCITVGVFTRIGATALAVFTAAGWQIHRVRWQEAEAFATDAQQGQEASLMGWSAYSGHFSSALKNIGLVGALVAIALIGPKQYAIAPLWF